MHFYKLLREFTNVPLCKVTNTTYTYELCLQLILTKWMHCADEVIIKEVLNLICY